MDGKLALMISYNAQGYALQLAATSAAALDLTPVSSYYSFQRFGAVGRAYLAHQPCRCLWRKLYLSRRCRFDRAAQFVSFGIFSR